MMRRPRITAGDRFGRLVVLEETDPVISESGNKRRMFVCQCDCGATKTTAMMNLRQGRTRSCGCLRAELQRGRPREKQTPSGLSRTSEHTIWHQLKCRCLRPSSRDYPYYGGRGVQLCERWLDFLNFLADMGPRPSPEHSIDRIDVDGDYTPENCRWATKREQARNSHRNRIITVDGVSHCLVEWAELTGLRARLIRYRIDRLGWRPDEAVMTPPGQPRRRSWLNHAMAA